MIFLLKFVGVRVLRMMGFFDSHLFAQNDTAHGCVLELVVNLRFFDCAQNDTKYKSHIEWNEMESKYLSVFM